MPPQNQQPNQNPQADYSIDYFNEISSPVTNSGGPSAKVMIVAIVVALLAVVLFAFTLFSSEPSIKQETVALQQRMLTLQEITDDHHEYLKDSDLRGVDSSLQLFLADSLKDIEKPLTELGIDPEKAATEQLLAKEAAYKADIEATLEDARLNAVLDRTYARELVYELSVVRDMMKDIASQSESESLDEFLTSSDANLTPIAQRFEQFTERS